MEPVLPLEWGRILLGEQESLYFIEIIARVFIIYFLSLIVLRTGGKRSRKQMTPLELLLVVALGSAVGDALFYPSVAIMYTTLILLVVVVLQWITDRAKRKVTFLEDFLNAKPKLILKKGKVIQSALDQENLTTKELFSALREKEIRNTGQVEYAFLELSGNFSVFTYEKGSEKEGEDILPIQQDDIFMRS